MSSDYNSGFDAGRSGNMLGGPATAEGTAGFLAGQAAANTKYSGSAEWIIAPLVLWPFVLIFYPVGGVATVLTALLAEKFALLLGLGGSPMRWAVILVPTIIVCWTVVRKEQSWGLNRTWYLARHVVRMIVLALLMNGGATNAWRTARDLPALPGWEATYHWPPQWLAIGIWLLFWQVLFIRAYQLRIYWNIKLKMWFFRPKDFAPFYFSWKRADPVAARQAPIEMPGRRSQ